MSELLPVLLGAAVGVTIVRGRPALLVPAAAVAGALASAVNGELGASWVSIAVDAAMASVSGLAARTLLDRRHSLRRLHG